MDSRWKSSFGRSRTPMGTVPISVIYGYKYPLRESEGNFVKLSNFLGSNWNFCLNIWCHQSSTSPRSVSPIPATKTSQVSSSCLPPFTSSRSVWPSSLNNYKPPEIVRTPGWWTWSHSNLLSCSRYKLANSNIPLAAMVPVTVPMASQEAMIRTQPAPQRRFRRRPEDVCPSSPTWDRADR